MYRNATQNPGESPVSYCTWLRYLAQTREFANKGKKSRHRIVPCSSSRLQRRAQGEDMTLKSLCDYGRGLENVWKASYRHRGTRKVSQNIGSPNTQKSKPNGRKQEMLQEKNWRKLPSQRCDLVQLWMKSENNVTRKDILFTKNVNARRTSVH